MPVDFNTHEAHREPQYTDLSEADIIAGIAHHEAGHTVIGMTHGMSLKRVRVRSVDIDGYMGWTGTTIWNISWGACFNVATEFAAGEAAKKRHLLLTGMDPHRAAALAVAPHDRDTAVQALAACGYTITLNGPAPHPDNGTTWTRAMAAADRAVETHWQQITAVAEALIASPKRELSGDQVSALTGIPNTAPSPAA
ncbi:hypothetical protein [Streptomyces zhihengii]